MNTQILDETVSVIREVLRRQQKDYAGKMQASLLLRDDLGLDSIDMVILQVALEDNYHIRFDPLEDDFSKLFYRIGSLCEYLDGKTGGRDEYQQRQSGFEEDNEENL